MDKLFDIIQSDHWCNSCCLICSAINKWNFFHRKPQPSKQILQFFVTPVRKIWKLTVRSGNTPSSCLSKPKVFSCFSYSLFHFILRSVVHLKWEQECLHVLGLMEALWSLPERLCAFLVVWICFLHQSLG